MDCKNCSPTLLNYRLDQSSLTILAHINRSSAVKRFKAHFEAQGCSQNKGLDYHETFSHVVKIVTVRTILSITDASDWNIR